MDGWHFLLVTKSRLDNSILFEREFIHASGAKRVQLLEKSIGQAKLKFLFYFFLEVLKCTKFLGVLYI